MTRCRNDELEVQGWLRRAEPSAFRVMPHPHFLPTVRTMDDDDAAFNPFSSSHVWNHTASNEHVGTFESSLFAPLELDSRFSRVNRAQTRRIHAHQSQ